MIPFYKKLPFFLRPSKMLNLFDSYISLKFLNRGISIRDKLSSDKHIDSALKCEIQSSLANEAKKFGYVELPNLSNDILEKINLQFDKFILNGIDTSMDKSKSQLAIPLPQNKIDFHLLLDNETINTIKSYFEQK